MPPPPPHQVIPLQQLHNLDHYPTRSGFDSHDFNNTSTMQSTPESASHLTISPSHTSSHHPPPLPPSLRQHIYSIIYSTPLTIFIAVLLAIDFFFFLSYLSILLTQPSTPSVFTLHIYPVVDWLVAIVYLVHVNLHLYSYGISFYFTCPFRALDYLISLLTFSLITAYSITSAAWLPIARFLRLIRILTCIVIFRDRQMYQKTRQQLVHLSSLLHAEKSDHSKLTRWQIDPHAIAIGKPVGHGSFGAVYTALFRGTLVAIKQISYPHNLNSSPKSDNPASLEDEAVTLVNLRHPNIILFMGFVHDSSKLCIMTEYCSRGSLRDVLDNPSQQLSHSRLLKLALGIARGLAYLHGQRPPILHLDLKTSNVLISSGWDAKLGDFGLSRSMDKIENDWFSGTMQYAAPEILHSNKFSTAADIYSFGICLWEMAAREIPYQGMLPSSVLWGVVKNNLRPPLDKLSLLPSDNPIPIQSKTINPDLLILSEDIVSPLYNAPISSPDFDTTSTPGDTATFLLQDTSISQQLIASPHGDVCTRQQFGHADHADRQQTDPLDRTDRRAPVRRKRKSAYQTHLSNAPDSSGNTLQDLSRKVTEAIEMFDDRPPMIKRRQQADHSTDSESQSFNSRALSSRLLRRNFNSKGAMKSGSQSPNARQLHTHSMTGTTANQSSLRSKVVVDNNKCKADLDPFSRRLTSFTRKAQLEGNHGTSATDYNKSKTGDSKSGFHEMDTDSSWTAAAGGAKGDANTPQETSDECVNEGKKEPVQVAREYVELIEKCWAQDPGERPSAGDIVWRLVILIDNQMREEQ